VGDRQGRVEDQSVALVNTRVVSLLEEMEPRHVALFISKILNPDARLIELSKDLWPNLGYASRRLIVHQSNVTKLWGLVRSRPWVLTAVLANKVAPVAIAVLFELTTTAQKENVRATAAREILRLAQSTARSLQSSDEEPVPTDELDALLEGTDPAEDAAQGADAAEPDDDPFDMGEAAGAT